MIPDQYVWPVWASAFLVPWVAAFTVFPHYRQPMVLASICTMPLGLTEPLFVPAYWSPPSFLDLARTTGFDIESLIFSFAIGGIGAVLYDIFAGRVLVAMPAVQQHATRHKLHYVAIAVVLSAAESIPLESDLPGNHRDGAGCCCNDALPP